MQLAWLFWGTIAHRPYVYAFFVVFLFFSRHQMGWKKTGLYLLIAYFIALFSELSSTRYGIPFGYYTYIDEMRTRELWISNVPFWDSLSFVFLSYFSWNLAVSVQKSVSASWVTYCLSGLLMMLLDVVIDPLTLLGDKWFLGKIYYYPGGGTYFGVTLANFFGWFVVGSVTPWLFQSLTKTRLRMPTPLFNRGVFAVYTGVLLFNLGITAWIGEWKLLSASLAVALITLSATGLKLHKGAHV
jgi:uncharacterized membrane protein